MSKENKSARAFDFAATQLRAEITLFWQRSLFFWGFIAAAFVAYGVLANDKELALAVACFGLVCSVAWTLANRGSKYWQVAWEQKLRTVEVEVLGSALFSRLEQNTDRSWWGAATYSVTRLTIALSDFTVLVWIALGYKASPIGRGAPWTYESTIMVGVTAAYLVAILMGTKSRNKRLTTQPARSVITSSHGSRG